VGGQVRIDRQGEIRPLSRVCTYVEHHGTPRQEMFDDAEFAVGHHVAVTVSVVPFHVTFAKAVQVPVSRQYLEEEIFHRLSPFKKRVR
jgi:hypothetical protein